MMMELPGNLDSALTLAAEGSARVNLLGAGTTRRRTQRNSMVAAVALIMVLVSSALLLHYLAASAAGGAWLDRISAIVFVTISALLLRTLISRV